MSPTEITVTAFIADHGTIWEFEGLDPQSYPVRFFADHRMGRAVAEDLADTSEDTIAMVEDWALTPLPSGYA
jgi:hypothetical protein